jgi:N-acetylated-alpha-linked acidic dipeptidase
MKNTLVDNNVFNLVNNPKDNLKSPEAEEVVPYFNFAPLENAMRGLKRASNKFAKSSSKGLTSSKNNIAINAILKDMERELTREHGLPKRPWYRHHIYAPGFYTGYGVKTLPGVREALEQKEFEEVKRQVVILENVLIGFTAKIEEATRLLN